jgi:hypothetical protein
MCARSVAAANENLNGTTDGQQKQDEYSEIVLNKPQWKKYINPRWKKLQKKKERRTLGVWKMVIERRRYREGE